MTVRSYGPRVLGMGLLVLVAACSVPRIGIAHPTPHQTSASPVTAPPVRHNLPVVTWAQRPCSLFTSSQLRALGLTPATTSTRDRTAVMVGCDWFDPTVGAGIQLDVEWITALPHGLTDIYAQQDTAAYWLPVTIDGYPGVLTDTVDERREGTCRMDLGVTNSAVLDLAYQGAGNAKPCTRVGGLAREVIDALKGMT